MTHKHAFEAVDRTMQDIMAPINPAFANLPFGGKVVVMGGDFRQTLPVVRRGNRADIVRASLTRASFWNKVRVLRLHLNMRVRNAGGQNAEFADYLKKIGDGKEEV
jgi:ATP-dependent DNA helicase PIF1